MPPRGNVYVIDDDPAMRDSLEFLLDSVDFQVVLFESAVAFLDVLSTLEFGCVVSDVRMPGIDGMDLLKRLKANGNPLPVVIMTGHGDVPLAVEAMKLGAFDFFEKPFNDNDLATRIGEALAHDARQRVANAAADTVKTRLSSLTSRERQIMELVLAGKFNKVIADELNISMRTVEVHRANLFDKMQVKTAVELANLLKFDK